MPFIQLHSLLRLPRVYYSFTEWADDSCLGSLIDRALHKYRRSLNVPSLKISSSSFIIAMCLFCILVITTVKFITAAVLNLRDSVTLHLGTHWKPNGRCSPDGIIHDVQDKQMILMSTRKHRSHAYGRYDGVEEQLQKFIARYNNYNIQLLHFQLMI